MTLNPGLFSHQTSETWSEDLGWKPSIWHINFQGATSFFIFLFLFAFICIRISLLSCHEVCLGWSDCFCMVATCTHLHTHTHPWTDKEKNKKNVHILTEIVFLQQRLRASGRLFEKTLKIWGENWFPGWDIDGKVDGASPQGFFPESQLLEIWSAALLARPEPILSANENSIWAPGDVASSPYKTRVAARWDCKTLVPRSQIK